VQKTLEKGHDFMHREGIQGSAVGTCEWSVDLCLSVEYRGPNMSMSSFGCADKPTEKYC
jgi:hypothetical protein